VYFICIFGAVFLSALAGLVLKLELPEAAGDWEQPVAAGVMVRSQIVEANGEPVNVVHDAPHGDSWLISDIYLDGAISEVATRRSEFAAILMLGAWLDSVKR
jgi:ABC-type transporter MlaC component